MSILFFHFDGTTNGPEDAHSSSEQDESISNVVTWRWFEKPQIAA